MLAKDLMLHITVAELTAMIEHTERTKPPGHQKGIQRIAFYVLILMRSNVTDPPCLTAHTDV